MDWRIERIIWDIYILISVAAFAVLGSSYKVVDRLNCDRAQTNLLLYGAATATAVIAGLSTGGLKLNWVAVLIGLCTGASSYACIVALREAVTKCNISTAWTVVNLGITIPVAASIIFFGDSPKPIHYAGFILTLLTIVLFGLDMNRSPK